jgi:hypothetical protein
MKKLTILPIVLLLMLSHRAQAIDGDMLTGIIGTKVDAPATQKFLNEYNVSRTADGIFASTKTGIDIRTSHDTIVSMTLYRDNLIYGKYSDKLPKGVAFDLTSDEVIKHLGKPTTLYANSGYCEYDYGKYMLTCWFEKGALDRIVLSLK